MCEGMILLPPSSAAGVERGAGVAEDHGICWASSSLKRFLAAAATISDLHVRINQVNEIHRQISYVMVGVHFREQDEEHSPDELNLQNGSSVLALQSCRYRVDDTVTNRRLPS